jgi:tRNA U55 pseudouridine synthase TruB
MAMTRQQRLDCIFPTPNLLADLPNLMLNQDQVKSLYYGQSVDIGVENTPGLLCLYDDYHTFIGLGKLNSSHNLSPKRLMAR